MAEFGQPSLLFAVTAVSRLGSDDVYEDGWKWLEMMASTSMQAASLLPSGLHIEGGDCVGVMHHRP